MFGSDRIDSDSLERRRQGLGGREEREQNFFFFFKKEREQNLNFELKLNLKRMIFYFHLYVVFFK